MGLASLGVMIGAVAVAVLASRRIKVAMLSLVAFLPFSFGNFHGVPSLLVVEWVVPALAPIVAAEMLRSGRPVLMRRSQWLFLALAAFACVALVNYLRLASVAQHDTRAYFDILVGMLLLVELGWYARDLVHDRDAAVDYLAFVTAVGLALTLARLANFYWGTPLPLLGRTFVYGGEPTTPTYAVSVARIGGIAEAGGLGLCSLAALWYGRRPRVSLGLLVLVFVLAAIASGGRTFMAALLCGAVVYVALLSTPRWRASYVVASAVGAVAIVAAGVAAGLMHEFHRLLSVQGGIARQSPDRWAVDRTLWHQFTLHPILGKGVGVAVAGVTDPFVSEQVTWGGHAAWLSVLGLFGALGAIAFVLLTVGVMVSAWRDLVAERVFSAALRPRDHLLVFIVLILVLRIVTYSTGGAGYDDFGLYAVVGLYVATLTPAEDAG